MKILFMNICKFSLPSNIKFVRYNCRMTLTHFGCFNFDFAYTLIPKTDKVRDHEMRSLLQPQFGELFVLPLHSMILNHYIYLCVCVCLSLD